MSEIKVVGNKIFFHCDVDDESVTELVTRLHEMSHYSKIVIFVKSDGGDLHAGLCAMDHIRACPSHVTTVADGFCASSATLLLFGGDKRLMMPNARILIHQLSSEFSGKFEEFVTEKRNLKSIMRQIRNIYSTYSEIPEEKLDKYMEKDICLSVSTCIKYKIVEDVFNYRHLL